MKISRDLLMYFLYGRNEEEATKGPLPVLECLPSDITIGHSMLPGAEYGVFARQPILRGLVVGPLNLPLGQSKDQTSESGSEEELVIGGTTSCTTVIHKSWTWLKYIQPARHPYEENARIDQTREGIFLRITHDISPGDEILAWYSDSSLSKFGVDCISYSATTPTPTSIPSPGRCTGPAGSPTSPHKPLLTSPHKPLLTSPHKPLIPSPPQMPAKAVCRLCGEVYSSYVELWAHVTTAHASTTPLPRTTPQLQTTTPTSILPNSTLPYPLPILPLNLGLPLTKPYALLSPRMSELLDKTSPDPFLGEGDVVVRECRDTERPYECGHCGKSFSLPSSLRRHIITHTGERPYKCGYCGRAFAGATTLNNHIRIHTGEKPHICHDCGAGFTQATQLNRHIRCCKNGSAASSNSIQHHTEIYVS